MAFKILSCDGGGIRGLITALLIQDLDEKFGIVSKADGYAGTSTGGLIALGLAAGHDIGDIVKIYREDGEEIFQPNGWLADEECERAPPPDSVEEMSSGPGVFSCQYTNEGLKKIALQLLQDRQLKQSNKLIVVNSARLWNGVSWAPAALSNVTGRDYGSVLMRDAALATSAAPTYFPPYEIGELGYFADGGTFANDPSMTAIGEALAAGRASGIDDLSVLSLGTGISPEGISPEVFDKYKPLNWGALDWLWPASWDDKKVPATALLNLTLDLTAQLASVQAAQILRDNYCRGNVTLTQPIGLDDWKAVKQLEQVTATYIASDAWAKVRSWVEQNW